MSEASDGQRLVTAFGWLTLPFSTVVTSLHGWFGLWLSGCGDIGDARVCHHPIERLMVWLVALGPWFVALAAIGMARGVRWTARARPWRAVAFQALLAFVTTVTVQSGLFPMQATPL